MVSAFILFSILVFGDVVSVKTKARIPMMFVAFITYLALTWIGMPKDYPTISGLGKFGELMVPLLVIHMATLVPPHEYLKYWRAVVVSLISVMFSNLSVIFIGSILFGYQKMLASAGSVSGGGAIAALVSMEHLKAIGMGAFAVVPLVAMALVDPVGQPIAVNLLRNYARSIKLALPLEESCEVLSETDEKAQERRIPYGTDENPSIRYKAIIPAAYETEFVILLKLFALSLISIILEKYSGINMLFWCLALGLGASHFGLLRGKILERSNSLGIALAALLFYAFTMMNEITPHILINEFATVALILVLAVMGLLLGGWFGARLVKWPKELGMAVGIGIIFGFPGNLMVSTEVARSIGDSEKEKNYIMEQILPPMLVGSLFGFAFALSITVVVLMQLI